MGVLGTGVNEAWIYDQRGETAIAPLENASDIKWSRKLNDISDATVTVATQSHGDCCGILGNIATWGHSIVIFRSGVRVWEGPITQIVWRRGSVTIQAYDVLGWAYRKLVNARVQGPTEVYVEGELALDLQNIFAAGTFDPNVAAHYQRLGVNTGPTTTRLVKIFSGYYADDMINELVKAGGMFTTVGRRIITWPSTYVLGRIQTLLPETYMTAEIEIIEDGMDLACAAVGVNDEGLYGGAPANLIDPFYGRVEQLVPAGAVPYIPGLQTVATQFREQHYPAQQSVNVPAGSVLSCDAPYDMADLVAGVIVPVKIEEGLCKHMDSTQQLTSVEVTHGSSGEAVAITVQPLSGVLT